jgi:hypothetical protein
VDSKQDTGGSAVDCEAGPPPGLTSALRVLTRTQGGAGKSGGLEVGWKVGSMQISAVLNCQDD